MLFAQVSEGYSLGENKVANGDFEKGNIDIGTHYKYTNKRSYPYGPMVDEGEYGVTNRPKTIHHMFNNCGDHTTGKGQMMVVNGSDKPGKLIWLELFKVKPNTRYEFSCWVSSAVGHAPAELEIQVKYKTVKRFSLSRQTCHWQQLKITVTTPADAKYVAISLVNSNRIMDGNDFFLDDISFREWILDSKEEELQKDTAQSPVVVTPEPVLDTPLVAEQPILEGYTPATTSLLTQQDIRCNEVMNLPNIQFHDNTTRFKGIIAARKTMFLIFDYMRDNPQSTLTLYGHSDIFGDPDSNLELTKDRVIKIQRWLSMQGINKDRISYEWFGGTKPINAEGGVENRRVEARLECSE